MKRIFSVLSAALCLALLVSCSNPSGGGSDDNSGTPQSTVYTVTFDSQDATTPATPATMTVTSPARTVAALPTDPTKTGFKFGGWIMDKGGKGTQFTASTEVTGNITVYAKWTTKPVYVVSFDTTGGSTVASQNVEEGSFASVPAVPTKAGYSFVGWWTGMNGTGTQFTASTTVSSDIKVFAYWTITQVYSVTFNTNGGTAIAYQSVTQGSLVALPSKPYKADSTFDGWYTNNSFVTHWDFATMKITGNTILYAKWLTFSSDTNIDGSITIGKYSGSEPNVIIPSNIDGHPVTGIGYNSFYANNNITSIIIPETVTSLPMNAFTACTNLTSVTLPDTMTAIGEKAFMNCKKLETVNIPTSLSKISQESFHGCNNLKSITIPESITTIENNAFAGCGFTSISIPDHVTTLGDGVFSMCANLKSVSLPDSVTSLGSSAFAQCTNLTTVENLGKITTISSGMFSGCSNLTTVVIPPSVITIGVGAFSNCRKLESITIPETVKTICNSAFTWCTALTSITIPDSVTAIEGFAFDACGSLTTVTIGKNIASIGDQAFWSCSNIQTITLHAITPPAMGTNVLMSTINATTTVPAASLTAYQKTIWSLFHLKGQ